MAKQDPAFTLFWKDGKRQIVRGRNVAEAMTLAGYGGGAARALAFWSHGEDHSYYWNTDVAQWDKVPPEGIGNKPAHAGVRRSRNA